MYHVLKGSVFAHLDSSSHLPYMSPLRHSDGAFENRCLSVGQRDDSFCFDT